MCIRDSAYGALLQPPTSEENSRTNNLDKFETPETPTFYGTCLLYTSDAADERSSVDLGGRRIIKKKNNTDAKWREHHHRNNKKEEYIQDRN